MFILSLKVSQISGLDDFFLNTNIWPQHAVSLERSMLQFPNLTLVEFCTSKIRFNRGLGVVEFT